MEDLAYRRLLDQYYLREGPLPPDIQSTAKLIRMRSMVADVESVLTEFFTLTDDGWRHARCDSEIERMQDKQAKARMSAQASVNARRAKSLNVRSTDVDNLGNGRSTDVNEIPTDVELPTPTPTPTPIVIVDAPPKAVATQQGSRLQADWVLPDEWRQWAESERPDLDAVKVSERFKDFWIAKPGKDGRKLDWLATWRNWVRNQSQGQQRPVPTVKPGSDEYMQAHKNAQWWRDAGFSSVYEAANKRCWHHNAKDFANGERKEIA